MGEDSTEEDAELDSLDSHLPEFRSTPNPLDQMHASTTVLPTHDGLGAFPLDRPGITPEMQENIYAFERYNPRRIKRRRESLDLGQLQLEHEQMQEYERTQRIEAWRLEQSRLLLEEIQKETRRMRLAEGALSNTPSERALAEGAVSMGSVGDVTPDTTAAESEWHDQDADEMAREPRGIWSRITRKLICELVGIDDRMLSILFGEALPGDAEDMASTPKASDDEALTRMEDSHHDSSWQVRMLDRITQELGLLIHRLSAHPGAFSTYVRVQQMPIPYAGLPVIPETTTDVGETGPNVAGESTSSVPQFRPTMPQTQPMGIPRRTPELPAESAADSGLNGQAGYAFTQREWEQDLDIKLVFRYLRSRFMSRSSAASPGTAHLATQDAAAKAARVRQHHPLVGRPRQADRRTFRVTAPLSPVAMRHPSSCASQSTRRSARRSSVSSRHSSRHYWDLAGSIGTGSIIASTGPMGSWGEV